MNLVVPDLRELDGRLCDKYIVDPDSSSVKDDPQFIVLLQRIGRCCQELLCHLPEGKRSDAQARWVDACMDVLTDMETFIQTYPDIELAENSPETENCP
ncbi:MAG: hypothetical protein ACKVRP_00350 [Bacteroidota bacterium]